MSEISIEKGAQNIINYSMDLHPGQELMIIFDETTLEVVDLLAKTAIELNVQPTMLYIPQSIQQLIPRKLELSLLTQRMFQQVRAVINCVNGLASCIPFRDSLLEVNWSAHTRVGHMPGVSLDVLNLANVDFIQLSQNCRALAMALTYGSQLELISYRANGEQHLLNVPIGGWDRIAVASDGIISDGVWGNVPSGEAYIAPLEGAAYGSIVINGSMPGLIIPEQEELIIHFKAGQVLKIEPENSLAATWLWETQIQKAILAGDQAWSNLAEIGIGVNPGFDHLTGNMLLDEKLSQTAHIALGSNLFMGGRIKSLIHCDLVTRKPTILIDGHGVLEHGNLVLNESEWRLNYCEVKLTDGPLASTKKASRSGVPTQSEAGLLQRCNYSEPGKMFSSYIGDDQTAELADRIYNALPVDGEPSDIKVLTEICGLDPLCVRQVLHVMWLHELIRVE